MSVPRLAWSLFAVGATSCAVGVVLLVLVPAAALEREGDVLLLSLSFVLVLLAFGLVGALVASRLPANPIGWLFLVLWVIEGAYELAYGYTHYSLAVEALPMTAYTAWFANWSSVTSPAFIGLAILLFPDGRLLSRRWRPAAWLCVLAVVPVLAQSVLGPGPLIEFPRVRNPLGVDQLAWLADVPTEPLFLAVLACAAAALIVRFRRSHGVERQQVKWFAWAAAMIPIFLLVGGVASKVSGSTEDSTADYIAGFVFAAILAGLPIAAGVAILRYRLYDIDLVIKRTLVYGSLTAMLVAAYLVIVLLLRLAFRPVAGESDLAVAASTLAVAALFRPLRARIQSVVDRRFFRSRYDAERTLESFTGRLRDELDLESLGADLRSVVHETLQPAQVSLWLRSTS
ncbi:MAG: hypothetical protein M4D85_00830 [Actinomycetota bacterium]|nr:hypothetical protein [Actinomycetota bacterium]MDQ3663754.1 hypothetical protein [Actinomycetota bacterium]